VDSAEATERLTVPQLSMAPANKREDGEDAKLVMTRTKTCVQVRAEYHDALRRSSGATRLVNGSDNSREPIDRAALLYDPPLIAVTAAA
jgi:hypothetical protein